MRAKGVAEAEFEITSDHYANILRLWIKTTWIPPIFFTFLRSSAEKVRIHQKSFVLLLNLVAVCIIAREGKAKIIVQFLAAKKGFEIFLTRLLW